MAADRRGVRRAVQYTCRARLVLTQRIVPEPNRDVLLIKLTLDGDQAPRPYVLMAPYLGGTGHGNQANAYPLEHRNITDFPGE